MYIKGIPREQLYLFDEKLDDIIQNDNTARFIDAYVEKLDLTKLGFKIKTKIDSKGRPPYNPATMLKIYIYGYLNKIRSSRKLETECKRNTELIWLTLRLAPDFKTIADFRKDNRKGIKKIFKEFLKLCHKLDLLSLECVAIDGTKARAQNSLDNIYKRDAIDQIEQRIHEKIEKYLEELESNDRIEEADDDFLIKNLPEKLKKLKKSQDKLQVIKQMFEENPELEIYFANDPDARYQRDNNRIDAGYNCQSVVDDKNNLIISNDITNESNDLHQLNNMKSKVDELKKELEIEKKTVVLADAGYFEEEEVLDADRDENFEVYVSHPRDCSKKRRKKNKDEKIPAEGYRKDDFKYDSNSNTFECPEGKKLKQKGNGYIKKGSGTKKYQFVCKECDGCDKRPMCTKNKKGRVIKTTEYMGEILEYREKCKTERAKALMAKRKEMVEHPFGTIKRNWGYQYFMQKGMENVSTEFSFITFIYNFRRVLNLVSLDNLMEALDTI